MITRILGPQLRVDHEQHPSCFGGTQGRPPWFVFDLVRLHAQSPWIEKCLLDLGPRNTVACDVPHVGVVSLEAHPGTSERSIYHGIAETKLSLRLMAPAPLVLSWAVAP